MQESDANNSWNAPATMDAQVLNDVQNIYHAQQFINDDILSSFQYI